MVASKEKEQAVRDEERLTPTFDRRADAVNKSPDLSVREESEEKRGKEKMDENKKKDNEKDKKGDEKKTGDIDNWDDFADEIADVTLTAGQQDGVEGKLGDEPLDEDQELNDLVNQINQNKDRVETKVDSQDDGEEHPFDNLFDSGRTEDLVDEERKKKEEIDRRVEEEVMRRMKAVAVERGEVVTDYLSIEYSSSSDEGNATIKPKSSSKKKKVIESEDSDEEVEGEKEKPAGRGSGAGSRTSSGSRQTKKSEVPAADAPPTTVSGPTLIADSELKKLTPKRLMKRLYGGLAYAALSVKPHVKRAKGFNGLVGGNTTGVSLEAVKKSVENPGFGEEFLGLEYNAVVMQQPTREQLRTVQRYARLRQFFIPVPREKTANRNVVLLFRAEDRGPRMDPGRELDGLTGVTQEWVLTPRRATSATSTPSGSGMTLRSSQSVTPVQLQLTPPAKKTKRQTSGSPGGSKKKNHRK